MFWRTRAIAHQNIFKSGQRPVAVWLIDQRIFTESQNYQCLCTNNHIYIHCIAVVKGAYKVGDKKTLIQITQSVPSRSYQNLCSGLCTIHKKVRSRHFLVSKKRKWDSEEQFCDILISSTQTRKYRQWFIHQLAIIYVQDSVLNQGILVWRKGNEVLGGNAVTYNTISWAGQQLMDYV